MKNRVLIALLIGIMFLPSDTIAQKRISANQAIIVSTNYFRTIGIVPGRVVDIEEDYLNDTLCLYCVHFMDGSWTIVSASEEAFPILAHGKDHNMSLINSDNPGFNSHIWRYKRSILDADNISVRNKSSMDLIKKEDVVNRWQNLLYSAKGVNSVEIVYNPGVELLNIPGRGKIKWGQNYNNDCECLPSYNRYCRPGLLDCTCDRTPTGCAPVAMGQIMWYWQWPRLSPEDGEPYDWEDMPCAIYSNTDTNKANKIAKLLKDLGENMGAIYNCSLGTGVTQGNALEGFMSFGYNAVDRRQKRDWDYGYSWTELVRTEIDCHRPVFVFGENGTIIHGHYFVVDGYEANDNEMFHINWGRACNGNNYRTEYYQLDATPYSDRMSCFVGISPSYNTSEIIQRYHDNCYVTQYLSAIGNLTLPDATISTIGSGEKMVINAGSSVTLYPGFKALAGCDVNIGIDLNFFSTFDIVILGFPDFDDIVNEGVSMKAVNANSFECTIYENGGNDPVYQHSGTVRDNSARLWDGADYNPGSEYKFDVTLRNNFGKKYHIIFYNTQGETSPMPSLEAIDDLHITNDLCIQLFPNPASNQITVSSSLVIKEIDVFTLTGICLKRLNADTVTTTIDISKIPNGTYMLRIKTSKGIVFKKMVVK